MDASDCIFLDALLHLVRSAPDTMITTELVGVRDVITGWLWITHTHTHTPHTHTHTNARTRTPHPIHTYTTYTACVKRVGLA